jgi:hypothetical protein
MSRVRTAAVLAAVLSLSLTPSARAGSYTVRACGSDGVNRAFWAYANAGLSAFASCPGVDYQGEGTGLVARAERNANGGRLGLHASAWQIFEAPPGAGVQSMSFRVSGGRGSGCWAIGVWGWSADAFHPGDHLWGYGADCNAFGGGWSWFAGPLHLDLGGRQKVRLGVRCDAGGGCPTNTSVGTWTSLKDVAITVRDDSPPAIAPKGGALLGGGWHRGRETAWAGYGDNVGIRHIYGELDGSTFSFHDFAQPGWPPHITCDYARPRPCGDISDGGVEVNTATVPDGTRRLRLVAVDAAGNVAAHERTIRVDNHAPAAPRAVGVDGGDGWRRSDRFDVAWENPPGQVAPIVRALWRLCRASAPADCRTGARDAREVHALPALHVPESGDWTLTVWLQDEAGNVDPAHAADPVNLRLDEVAPETPGFDAPDAADPRRLALPVGDRHSGVAAASIELRRRGGGDWRALRTGLEPDGRAAAHVPDTELADGAYEVRATVRDHAGNETATATDRTGRAMTIVLPVRQVTRFTARHSAARRCRTARRRRVCRLVISAPEVATLREPLRPPFGRAATVTGVLETWQGRPVAGAPVAVHERLRTRPEWRALAPATTDAAGRFTVPVAAGPSRFLHLAYAGDALLLPAALEARALVPAAGSLRASRRRARNGGRVVFSGRLKGRPLPPGGRTVDLQAHYRGAWRTFATPRTGAHGRWRHPYRFGATRGRVVYRFRAAIKRDAAYPYEHGVTPTVRVIVTG